MTRKLKLAFYLLIPTAIYIAGYIPYSVHGRYDHQRLNLGGMRHWEPAFGDSTLLKTLYSPLVEFDRRCVHPSYLHWGC